MKSLRRHGIFTAAEAACRFASEPWKNSSSVRTESAVAPADFEFAGQVGGMKVGANQALRRGGFFQLGDHCYIVLALLRQGTSKAARHVVLRPGARGRAGRLRVWPWLHGRGLRRRSGRGRRACESLDYTGGAEGPCQNAGLVGGRQKSPPSFAKGAKEGWVTRSILLLHAQGGAYGFLVFAGFFQDLGFVHGEQFAVAHHDASADYYRFYVGRF